MLFPNVAGTVKGREELHEEEFYEKLALVSDLFGSKFSASDLGKWVQQLKALGLPDKSIQAIVEDYADTNPANDVHCFLADTPILLADGTEKPIQEIAPGDMVMSFDPKANSGLGAAEARSRPPHLPQHHASGHRFARPADHSGPSGPVRQRHMAQICRRAAAG